VSPKHEQVDRRVEIPEVFPPSRSSSGPASPLFLCSGACASLSAISQDSARPPERQFRGRAGTPLAASTQPIESFQPAPSVDLAWATFISPLGLRRRPSHL